METKAPEVKPTTRDVWMRGLFMFLLIIAFWAGRWLLNFPKQNEADNAGSRDNS